MGCAIFYKQCQEVNTIAWQILLGAPNTIKEDIIKQTMDKELKLVEQKTALGGQCRVQVINAMSAQVDQLCCHMGVSCRDAM